MADFIGYALFPGIEQIVSAVVSVSQGISPSVMQLEIAPQQSFTASGGTFSIVYSNVPDGGSTTIQYDWPNCQVVRHSFRRDDSGETWSLEIKDRRWKWTLGKISGTYNLRKEDGELDEDRKKSPKELAELCLKAMGEDVDGNPGNYLLDDLPTDANPFVEWDYDNPAEALASLCDELGCRVVLQLDDKVAIRVAGAGANLPSGPVLDNSLSIDPPERPDKIMVVGGHTRFQADVELEAVGVDTDDEIKPIDDLSYKPDGGWETIDINFFLNVQDPEANRDLARKWVFRAYRLKISDESPLTLPGYNSDGYEGDPIEDIKQVLPVYGVRVDTKPDDPTEYLPPLVYGKWYPKTDNLKNRFQDDLNPEAPDESVEHRDFRVDRKNGLIVFEDYVFANQDGDEENPTKVVPVPAELRVRISMSVRDPETWAWQRYEREREVMVGGQPADFGTEPLLLRHDEIIQTFKPEYNESYTITSVDTNESAIEAEADHYIDAAEEDISPKAPQTIKYAGFADGLELDGAINQITFEVGPAGHTVTISRNDEQVDVIIPYKERRRIERVKKLEAAVQGIDRQHNLLRKVELSGA